MTGEDRAPAAKTPTPDGPAADGPAADGTDAGATADPGTWVRAAPLSRCGENGCVRAVVAGGIEIVIARWDDEIFALEDNCSHEDYPLSDGFVEDGEIECVFHGAKFDLRSGAATQLPAVAPVKRYPVRVDGDDIYIRID